jgi:hypothetical protein
MPPRPLHALSPSTPAKTPNSNPSSNSAAGAPARAFKVLQSSRAPAQMSLALRRAP